MSESDNKNIINEEPKPKEEELFTNTPNHNSEQHTTQTESGPSQDIQNEQEQAELSEVETGKKDQPDFEEMINFNHTYLNYRIAKACSTRANLENSTFELLMTNVFIYSGKIIDVKSMTSLSNTEAVKNIREKIKAYKDHDLTNKITFIENVPFYVKTIGFQETVESILPIINDLPQEKETLAVRFFNVFPKFIDEIVTFGEKGYFILNEYMINLICDYLTKNNNNIFKKNLGLVKSICDGLVYMTQFIKDEDKGESVLTIVIKMAQDDDDDHKRESAMRLFGDLTPYVLTDLIQLYVIPQVNSFADDHCGNVRKEVANQLFKISQKVSKEIFKRRLLPVYKKISKDTLWNVKKAAAEILPKITKLCDSEIISKDIIPIFKSFAQDDKPVVKNAAVEVFGEFISLIDKKDADNFVELLDFYVETIQRIAKGKKDEKSIIQKCAFNFPAVLLFFGKSAWEKLKPCFTLMANEKDEKIKLPLASALGEISNILGSELTESDLLEFVDKFFKNSQQSSELKIKILQVLPIIIKNIASNRKNAYLEFIKYMIGNKDDKWRRRVKYSKIIGKFNGTYTDNIIYKRVFPIAINFCFDDISQVRSCSAKHNSRLILQLISGKTEFKEKTLKIVRSFAQSINYRYRQLFVYMCRHLFENEEVFKECISEYLLDLAYDKVPNVKIVLAKFISELLNKKKYAHLAKNETVRKIVKILKNDNNSEVLSYMNTIKDIEDIDVELVKNVNNKFTDNMKFVSSEFGITRNVPLQYKFNVEKFSEDKKEEQTTDGDTKIPEENGATDTEEAQKEHKKVEPETKGEETKTEETKTEETKTEETKTEETKTEETKTEETKGEETKEKTSTNENTENGSTKQ